MFENALLELRGVVAVALIPACRWSGTARPNAAKASRSPLQHESTNFDVATTWIPIFWEEFIKVMPSQENLFNKSKLQHTH